MLVASTIAPGAPPCLDSAAKMQSFDQRDFRQAMGRFATGITVVTMRSSDPEGAFAGPDGAPWPASPEGALAASAGPTPGRPRTYGITVNAFMSVSLDPPLVAVSIDKRARAHGTLSASERFGISVLSSAQEHLSDLFAGRPVKQRGEPFEELAGFPVVAGALAHIVCRPHQAVEMGDHTIFVGEVEALRATEGEPLLFFRGAYRTLPDLTLAR